MKPVHVKTVPSGAAAGAADTGAVAEVAVATAEVADAGNVVTRRPPRNWILDRAGLRFTMPRQWLFVECLQTPLPNAEQSLEPHPLA